MEKYTISTGKSRKDVSWKVREVTWDQLTARLGKVLRTSETMAEYFAMDKDHQGAAKDTGGFVGGPVCQDGPEAGRRKAGSVPQRSLVTLDADSVPEGTDIPSVIERTLPGTAFYAYTTHSHTPDAPRWRVIIPLARTVTADEYGPIVRRLCERAGMSLFDRTCVQPERLMYWPSCPADGEPDSADIEGDPLDPDNVLASYLYWHDAAEWPQFPGEYDVPKARKGGRAEDPTKKDNIVGTFCRAYDIHQAIAAFLPTVYRRNEHDPNRYTYTAGHTSNGFVVYDGGKFAYSNHGTDPVSGMMVNAFDLVRVHLFGSYDTDPDRPANRQPSWERMEDLVQTDEGCRRQRARDVARKNADAFGDADPSEGPEKSRSASEAKKQAKNEGSTKGPVEGPKSWMEEMTSELIWDKKGLADSLVNVSLILENDPRLKGRIQENEFSLQTGVAGRLPFPGAPEPDETWNMGKHVPGLRVWLEQEYRSFKKENVTDAIINVAQVHSYHPVRRYLQSLRWDGKARVEDAFIRHLGANDNRLNREACRKWFVAAVARVMNPGCKWDYVPVLSGPEGIGKSTFLRTIGKEWYMDSLISIEGLDGMQQLRGQWIVEIPEMTAMKKSNVDQWKSYLNRQVDTYRPSYGTDTISVPRQCVFVITTNEKTFMLGDTGNRRLWPIDMPDKLPAWTSAKQTALEEEVDQLWAEAFALWKAGTEPLYLTPADEMEMRGRQRERNEAMSDPRRGIIDEWLDRPIPFNWHKEWSLEQRERWTREGPAGLDTPTVPHEYTCATEILVACLGIPRGKASKWDAIAVCQILRSLGWEEDESMRKSRFDKFAGRQRWFRRPAQNEPADHLRDLTKMDDDDDIKDLF